MKVLILRFSSIGDIVLTTPVIRCLKSKYPNAQIHYATKKSFRQIIDHNPYIDKIHVLDHSLLDLIKDLRAQKFDCVIDLHNNQRTFLIKLLLGVKTYSFNKINYLKWLMVKFKINRLPDKHIVQRYLEACDALGVVDDGKGLDFFIEPTNEIKIDTLPHQFQNGYISWVVGAKQKTKQFPVSKVVEVINSELFPDKPIVLLGGKEDYNFAEEINKAVARSKNVLNACGKYSLAQSASLVKQSAAVITNDTGLMHIASAFHKPIVSIWGNTIPQFGMAPYKTNASVIEVNGLSCRPCSKLGYSECPQKHLKCMNMIKAQAIIDSLNAMIANSGQL